MDEEPALQVQYADDDARALLLKEAAPANPRVQALMRYLHERLGWQAQSTTAHKVLQAPVADPAECVLLYDGTEWEQHTAAIIYTPWRGDPASPRTLVSAQVRRNNRLQLLMHGDQLFSWSFNMPPLADETVDALARFSADYQSAAAAAGAATGMDGPAHAAGQYRMPEMTQPITTFLGAFMNAPALDTTSAETILAQLRAVPRE